MIKKWKFDGIEVELIQNRRGKKASVPELIILYVLEGEARVSVADKAYTFVKDGIILVNAGTVHQFDCGDNTIAFTIKISYLVLADVMQNECFTFICNTAADTARPYPKLREILNKIVYHALENQHRTDCMIYSLKYELLDCLIEKFLVQYQVGRQESIKDPSERLQIVINYINMNYQHQLSLNTLAEKLYLSPSSLSRFFKKETGVYFKDYVSSVRLHYALNDLLYSDEPLTKIAVDNGFSNPSVFSKVFQENFGMPPSQYRKKNKPHAVSETKDSALLEEKVKRKLEKLVNTDQSNQGINGITIENDIQNAKASRPFWNTVINIGSAYNLTLANLQYHTLYLVENLHFKYVRIWNLFSTRLKIRQDSRRGNYNFDSIDTILEFLVSHGMKPYLDFGSRPECAVKNGKEMLFYEEEAIEYQTKAEWENIVRSFMWHIAKRFGLDEISSWLYEYSFDVDHQKSGYDAAEFFKYYKSWYFQVKEAAPGARIGGPSIIIDKKEEIFRTYLNQCRQENCVPDFVTMILFPYQSLCDEQDVNYAQRITDFNFLSEQIDIVKNIMQECQVADRKLCITEWSNALSNRNYLNDSCFRAAFIMKMTAAMWGRVDTACFWMGSDWISTYYDSVNIIQGGVGLLTKDGVRKPAYYAIDFLNQLGPLFVSSGPNYIVTANEHGDYYIVCFNFKWYSANYYMKDEDDLDIRNLDAIFEDNKILEVSFRLKNVVSDQKYIVKKHLLNNQYGCILTEWLRFNCEAELSGSDLKYLRNICTPHLSMERVYSGQGELEFVSELQPHEIALFHIYKDY